MTDDRTEIGKEASQQGKAHEMRGKPFQAGYDPRRTGNGRKKTPEAVREAFEALLPRSVELLAELMGTKSKPPKSLRLAHAAAETVQDRVLGKPVELTRLESTTQFTVISPTQDAVESAARLALVAKELGLTQEQENGLKRALLFGEQAEDAKAQDDTQTYN